MNPSLTRKSLLIISDNNQNNYIQMKQGIYFLAKYGSQPDLLIDSQQTNRDLFINRIIYIPEF